MGSLEIGSSALGSFRLALDVTSQNIANANTEGYSRQRVDLATIQPFDPNGLQPGDGVHVTSIQRISDDFLAAQSRDLSADFNRLDSFHQLASEIDNLVADDQASLTPALQSFFNSVEQLNANPSSVPARTVMLGEARSLVDRFNGLDRQLGAINTEVNARITNEVNEINALARNIAEINSKVAGAGPNSAPNELLDSRDQMLKELAGHIAIQTSEQNGAINVYAANGVALVTGSRAGSLEVVRDPLDSQTLQVANANGVISGQVRGGSLAGILDFRREMLNPVRNELGRLATVLSHSFNQQHAKGLDLNGRPGGDFFSIDMAAAIPNSGNAGSGVVDYSISDPTRLTNADYRISYDGANYTVTRLSDQTTTTSASGSFNIDGLAISISGTPQAGDEFLLRPTHGAARNIGLKLTQPSEIAAASPLRSSASLGNAEGSDISSPTIVDASDPQLTNRVEIRFSSATDYELFDVGTPPGTSLGAGSLPADGVISQNGWQVTITGTPQAGNIFTVEANTGGYADNGNGRLLSGLQFDKTINGQASFQEGYSQLVNMTGQLTRQARIGKDAQGSLLSDVEKRAAAVSAVNLDEEAVNLTRYQQAYQAAAQVINTSQNLFDTIIRVVGR